MELKLEVVEDNCGGFVRLKDDTGVITLYSDLKPGITLGDACRQMRSLMYVHQAVDCLVEK